MQPKKTKKSKTLNYKEEIKKLFSKSPMESVSNSMTTIPEAFSIVWRPNNYRRQIEVKEKTNSTIKKIKSAIGATNFNPHTKLISIKNFMPNITIQYGKKFLTAIYSQNIIGGVKETYLIQASSIKDLEERIDQKKDNITNKIDKALQVFSRQFKIILPLKKPCWSRYEDFIKGEDFIDRIPREVIIHDTYFKKVYGKGIEFKNHEDSKEPTVSLKNYINNRAIEKISPSINNELISLKARVDGIIDIQEGAAKLMSQFVTGFLPIHKEHADNIKTHTQVLKGIKSAFNKMNNLLKERQKKLNDFL